MKKVAILGAWHVHAEEYARQVCSHPQFELGPVWDGAPDRAAELAGRLSVPHCSGDEWQGLLSDPAIVACVITSATTQHEELICACAQAGKHVFTEKVLTVDREAALRVQAQVRAAGIYFAISFPRLRGAGYRQVKALCEAGTLGQVTSVRFHNSHDGASGGWLPTHFFKADECGAGAMLDLGCHGMYLIQWLLGMPQSVCSFFTSVSDLGVDDNCLTIMRYSDGCLASNETSFVARGAGSALTVCGTEATVSLGRPDGQVRLRRAQADSWQSLELSPDLACDVHAWLDAIIHEDPGRVGSDMAAAVALTELMEAAYQADGRSVELA